MLMFFLLYIKFIFLQSCKTLITPKLHKLFGVMRCNRAKIFDGVYLMNDFDMHMWKAILQVMLGMTNLCLKIFFGPSLISCINLFLSAILWGIGKYIPQMNNGVA